MAVKKHVSKLRSISFIIVCIGGISLLFFFINPSNHNKTKEVSLEQSMDMMADWFDAVQRDRGDFMYRIGVPSGKRIKGNNIVRQAGSLYALGQYYAYTKDPETKKVLKQGFAYFKDLATDQGSQSTAITYDDTIKSNTSALLLLGLLEYIEADPNDSVEEKVFAKKLANYLVSTQTDKGSYLQTFEPEVTESDYNNGETMYALIRAYKVFKDPRYLVSAEKAAAYFENYYGKKGFVPAYYSWGMAGFAHLYSVQPKESYWQFMKQLTDAYLQRQQSLRPSASVFLEGAAHTAWIAKERDPEYAAKLKTRIKDRLHYLTEFQPGSPYSQIETEKKRLKGGVCEDLECNSIRIDFTQHNLSAIYLYLTKVE